VRCRLNSAPRSTSYLLPFDKTLIRRPGTETPGANTAILAVSKQTHREASDVLYKHNTVKFRFEDICPNHGAEERATPLSTRPIRSISFITSKTSLPVCSIKCLMRLLKDLEVMPADADPSAEPPPRS